MIARYASVLAMLIRYTIVGGIVAVGKLLAFLGAYVIALFVRTAEENQVTGFPSQFPGEPRAFLIPSLMGFQTHDDCLDAYWYAKRQSKWINKYNQEYYDTHWWLRYYCYVMWIQRNPAYDLAHSLGWYQRRVEPVFTKGKDLWGTGKSHAFLDVVKNGRGNLGFEFSAQWCYSKTHHAEVRLGYGVRRYSPRDLGIVNLRFHPAKKR